MEVSGQLHATAALHPVPLEYVGIKYEIKLTAVSVMILYFIVKGSFSWIGLHYIRDSQINYDI
jgi:hypothetical protein